MAGTPTIEVPSVGSVHKNRRSDKRNGAAENPPAKSPADDSRIDWREQTFNDGLAGPVERVSTPRDLITRLRAVVIDVDTKYLNPALYAPGNGTDAFRLYDRTVGTWLDRHPLWSNAEVRHTGSGLHVLIHVDRGVAFDSTADRDRWAAVVRAMQNTLPSDPNAPGLTALTRPIGSVNSKTGRAVEQLRPGTPVAPESVLQFVETLRRRPFATVAGILHGTDRVAPCPVCRADGSTLAAFDRVGQCYAKCGPVKLAQLFGTFMAPTSVHGEA